KKCVPVTRCTHYGLGADVVATTRPVLNDELLTEPLGKPLSDQAGEDVARATCGSSDDHAHRPHRIGLRPRDARHDRERGSARYQMQKLPSLGKFHGVL